MCPMAMAVSHFWEVITGAQVLSSNLTQLKRQQKKVWPWLRYESFPAGIRTKRKCKKKGKPDLKRNMSSAEYTDKRRKTRWNLFSPSSKAKRWKERNSAAARFHPTRRPHPKTVGLQIIKNGVTKIPRDLSTRLLAGRRGK